MSQAPWGFFSSVGWTFVTVQFSSANSSLSHESIFQSVSKHVSREHRTIAFLQSCKFRITLPWWKMAALQETCVCECAEGGGVAKRTSPTPESFYSIILPQPVKLPFLSNNNAKSLEIVSIMFGSSMQVQAGGKRTEWHAVPGNVRFQTMQKEKTSGPR